MKLAQLLQAYAPGRSAANVQVHIYNKETRKTEDAILTWYEVQHCGDMDWPLRDAKVESFEITHEKDILGLPTLLVNVSTKQ